MSHLTIIRGLPGSGKSTLAVDIACTKNIDHIEADQFHTDEAGYYNFDPTVAKYAHQMCLSLAAYLLWHDESVVVSNTFVNQEEIDPYLEMAHHCKASVSIIACRESYGSIHDVPDDVIEKMKSCWEEVTDEWPRECDNG